MNLPYKEGALFAVPLATGKYAVGIVARTSRKGKIILAYFFGPARQTVPEKRELAGLCPQDAVRIARVGDLSLIDKTWPIIGQLEPWDRNRWPIPPFVRRDDIMKRAWSSQYSDNDANQLLFEQRIDYARVSEFERDSVLGAGAAEIVLTKMLS